MGSRHHLGFMATTCWVRVPVFFQPLGQVHEHLQQSCLCWPVSVRRGLDMWASCVPGFSTSTAAPGRDHTTLYSLTSISGWILVRVFLRSSMNHLPPDIHFQSLLTCLLPHTALIRCKGFHKWAHRCQCSISDNNDSLKLT